MCDDFSYSKVMISDPVAIFVVLALVVYVALRLEERVAVCRSFGAALTGIVICIVLSNTGVLPGASATYDLLMGTGVRIAIALILLAVDVRTVLQAGGKMLAAFALGAFGAAVGSVVGGLLFFRQVGPETWKLAGQLTGTYTGGGMNFAALAQALGTSSSLFTSAVAADVVVSTLWFSACLMVPVLLGQPRRTEEPTPATEAPSSGEEKMTLARSLYDSGRPVPIADVAALVTIAVGAVWISGEIASHIPQVPQVLWLTTIALVAAQLPVVRGLAGSALWGNYILLLFLASNGAKSVIANIFRVGPGVFYFAAFTVTIHGIFIFGVGRLLKLELSTLVVASQANVGGPATALAMASARGYTDCILPGVAAGLLGYAVGNYWGFLIAMLMRGWLPG